MAKLNVYLHLEPLERDAVLAMEVWILSHKLEITKVDRVGRCVTCVNGDKHYFKGYHTYFSWCLGRDYILNGEHWHSNEVVKEIKDGKA